MKISEKSMKRFWAVLAGLILVSMLVSMVAIGY
jgi:hypothetical protein